jgi:CheY-like chemotaxis protein
VSPSLFYLLDAAIQITGAQMGSVQLIDKDGVLRVIAQRGFYGPFLKFFDGVEDGQAACGEAMRRRERVIVEDVTDSALFKGSRALEVLLAAGVRAVQSTPIVDRSGCLIGMLSTHFREPHRPDQRELRFLDLLARQVSALIERDHTLMALMATVPEGRQLAKITKTRESAKAMSEPDTIYRKILIVDDNLYSAHTLSRLLRAFGHKTHVAFDGCEALEVAQRLRPEVALLDISPPTLNGYDTCRSFRSQPWGEKMLLVALTAYGQARDVRSARQAGFDHQLVKPVNYQTLHRVLAAMNPRDARRPTH